MLFNSVEFLIFFLLVVITYFLLPLRFRIAFMLIASYYFYMSWKPEYAILIIISTLIDFYMAQVIERHTDERKRRRFLLISLASNLGILFFFKYYNFFSGSIQGMLALFNIDYSPAQLNVLLPVGISFYTFQSLSYTIDVYRRRQKAELNLGKFALYVSFFPQLVAGPIERSTSLLPQFDKKNTIDYVRITDGLKLMAWGFFKKIVIADRVAAVVNTVYNQPTEYTGIPLMLATILFAVQIYCDFSGYSDIAIGAAKVMGYNLMENFRQPYFATSIPDFWRRWHISLSTWFRDYLYIPLGGNRASQPRVYFNLFVVFLVSGLWHGANWTFVIWGAIHGLYILITDFVEKQIKKRSEWTIPPQYAGVVKVLQIGLTFALVLFAWIFFRANSLSDALYITSHLFSGIELRGGYGLNFGGAYETAVTFSAIFIFILVDFLRERGFTLNHLKSKPLVLRWAVYYILIISILVFGYFGVTEFIYFQF